MTELMVYSSYKRAAQHGRGKGNVRMKVIRNIFALVLVLGTLLSLGGAEAAAKQRDQLYWDLNDGVLTISGWGEMPDYTGDVAPWRAKDSKAKDVKSIEVESGVTHIGQQAFQYCESAKTVTIADSVESIGEAAFYGCKKLKEVRMPVRLDEDELAVSVFDHCTSLKSAIVPEGVEVIKNAAFNCCDSLEWVYIPASVEEIEDSAFNHCISLKDVYYAGSWSEWDQIEIAGYNKCLKNASIHFGSSPYGTVNDGSYSSGPKPLT